jgi:hypothetical protein
VNQQPPMHQLVILDSIGWATFFHSTLDGVHHSSFLFSIDHCTLGGGGYHFSPGFDLTHSYPTHFPTLISIAPTLVPYLLSPSDIATLITSYPIDLTTILTTYPTNLATLHTQPPY